ncbi:MAG: metallophosphoesterase [Phycisphaerae bacterium]|nr:metallophosphoesterase [Phycisphaerae bacterium]
MKKLYLSITIFVFFLGVAVHCRAEDSNSLTHSFYFVQIADMHLSHRENFDRTGKIIEKINALPFKVEFVVNTGDSFNDNIEDANVVKEALKLFSRLKSPIYYIAGNHDIDSEKSKTIYIRDFGQLNYVKEIDNVVFIFAYTNHKNDPNSLNAEFFNWLEISLKKAEDKPVIIFQHIPAGRDFYNNKFYDSWPIEAEKKWIELINSHKVKAVIAGHFHRNELHWFGGVPLYVGEPISLWLGRQAAFRVYEYKDGKIGYFTQYLDTN